MAKCPKCKKRKAKRCCPALGEYLCNLCCGLLREKEIHCPPNCSYLEKHKPYQEKKIIEKKETVPRDFSHQEDILKDERLAWLAFHIEIPLKEFGEKKESFTDRDAILALEYAKEKINKADNLIYIPTKENTLKNEAGEAVFQILEKCRHEKKIIIPGELNVYTKEEKIRCLERIISSAKFLTRGNFEGKNYIQQLINRFARMKKLSSQDKIITMT